MAPHRSNRRLRHKSKPNYDSPLVQEDDITDDDCSASSESSRDESDIDLRSMSRDPLAHTLVNNAVKKQSSPIDTTSRSDMKRQRTESNRAAFFNAWNDRKPTGVKGSNVRPTAYSPKEAKQISRSTSSRKQRACSPDSVIVIDSSSDEEDTPPIPNGRARRSGRQPQRHSRSPTSDSVLLCGSSESEPLIEQSRLARASFNGFTKPAIAASTSHTTEDGSSNGVRATSETTKSVSSTREADLDQDVHLQTPGNTAPSIILPSASSDILDGMNINTSSAETYIQTRPCFAPLAAQSVAIPNRTPIPPEVQNDQHIEDQKTSKYLASFSLDHEKSAKYPPMTSMRSFMEEIAKMRARREQEERKQRGRLGTVPVVGSVSG